MLERHRRAAAALAGIALLGALSGCSTGTAATAGADGPATTKTDAPKPTPVLTGKWEQSNKKSKDAYQVAEIKGDRIEVEWVSGGGDTTSLYWAGSFKAPTSADAYSWKSANDTAKTSKSLLASPDKTKTFTYEDGEISYKVSALGTTTTVRLEKK